METPGEMILIIETGLSESFSFLPDFFHKETDVIWFMMPTVPIGSLNGVFNSKLPYDSLSCLNRIEEIMEPFKSARVPFTWYITPSCRPSNLGSLLEKEGLTYRGEDPALALDLLELPALAIPEGLTIKLVENSEMLEQWSGAFSKVYNIPKEKMKVSRPFHEAGGYTSDAKVQHFVGILGSEVVSTCRVAYSGNIVTLSGMAVLENHRRKGIGASMTLYPLHLAGKRGYRFAVLGSSELALPLYEKLGFREYCKIRNYSAKFG